MLCKRVCRSHVEYDSRSGYQCRILNPSTWLSYSPSYQVILPPNHLPIISVPHHTPPSHPVQKRASELGSFPLLPSLPLPITPFLDNDWPMRSAIRTDVVDIQAISALPLRLVAGRDLWDGLTSAVFPPGITDYAHGRREALVCWWSCCGCWLVGNIGYVGGRQGALVG